ncbi:MAG TPA: helix-turn-helix domain-containing protein [Pyrinomonadaceae bacterium]|nr:helix-turn-helix domain-containing protein [Pyrinomonadaceae bacterium]
MRILQYPNQSREPESDLERRIQHLVLIAKALSSEIETLQRDLGPDHHVRSEPVEIDDEGIDFYGEIERYEIDLLRSALDHCGGNQTHAAKLLHLKATTLNAKLKHYGLNPVRTVITH